MNTVSPPTRLRTLQVVNVRWFNATAWYGLKLARLLKDAGHESHVAALAGTDTFAKAEAWGLDPVPLPLNAKNPLAFPALLRDMQRLILRLRPQVIDCHRGESFLFWAMLKKAGGYALVRTRGDQRLPKSNLPNKILHRHCADAVVATNSVMSRHFVNQLKVPQKRVHTVYGGVDTKTFRFDAAGRAATRARYGFGDEHFVIGLLGRFDHVKGQKELLAAVARLRDAGFRQVRLLFIGFPTAVSQEEVESWIQENGLGKEVVISGKVEDVAAHISALDVGVIASLWSESIARAALEIMACGRPLLSTAVGVMPDLLPQAALVGTQEMALPNVLPALLPDELAAVLRKGLAEPGWLAGLAEQNLKRILELTDEQFLAQSLDVYAEALQRRYGQIL